MARLPDSSSLGGLPSVRTGGRVTSINTSALDRGVQQFGQGVSKLGKAGLEIGLTLQKQQDAKQDFDTEIRFQEFDFSERKGLVDSTREVEPGQVDGYADGWQGGYMERAKEFMKTVPDSQRNLYERKLFSTERKLYGDALTFQQGEQKRTSVNDLTDLANTSFAARARTSSTGEMDEVVADFDKTLAKNPYLTKIEKDDLRRSLLKNVSKAHLDSLDPEKRLEVIQGVRTARAGGKNKLANFESGGSYTAFNSLGFSGKYQFGAPRLETLGVYKPGAGENLKEWNGEPADAPGKWSGTFNIPGHKSIKTVQQFLASPKAQEAVYKSHIKNIDNFINKNGLDKFIGQEINGVTITRDSIRYMAHLGGNGGARDYLQSGGAVDPADANGTQLSTYSLLGSERTVGGPSAAFASVSDKDLDAFETQAARDLKSQKIIADRELAAMRKQMVDELRFAVDAGQAGSEEIEEARKQGIFKSFSEYKTTRKIFEKKRGKQSDLDRFNKVLLGQAAFDPKDKDDKKMLNTHFEETISRDRLAAKDPAAADALTELSRTVGAIPTEAGGLLRAMLDSENDQTAIYAYQTLNRLRQDNPDAFGRDMPQGIERRVEKFGTQAEFTEEKKLLEQLRAKRDPVSEAVQKVRRTEAEKLTKELTADDLISDLDFDTIFEFSDPAVSVGPGQTDETVKAALLREYRNLYREEYARGETEDDAANFAKKQLMRVWGRSDATGTPRLMKHAPESYFQPIDGSYGWMQEQLETDVRAKLFPLIKPPREGLFGTVFDEAELPDMSLVPAPEFNPKKPAWQVVIMKDGLIDVVRNKSGGPLLYSFDDKPFLAKKEKQERANRAAKRRRELEGDPHPPLGQLREGF